MGRAGLFVKMIDSVEYRSLSIGSARDERQRSSRCRKHTFQGRVEVFEAMKIEC
jgi:hypothetical protein